MWKKEDIKNFSQSTMGWLKTNVVFVIIIIGMIFVGILSLAYAFLNGKPAQQMPASAEQISASSLQPEEKLQPINDYDDNNSASVNGQSTELPSRARACESDAQNTKGCETSSEAQPETKPTPCDNNENSSSHAKPC